MTLSNGETRDLFAQRMYGLLWKVVAPKRNKSYRKKFSESEKGKSYRRRWNQTPKGRALTKRANKAKRVRLKQEILEHYGKTCARCGFDDPRALTLDHVNNDGAQHRKTVLKLLRPGRKTKLFGHEFYYCLKREGYPPGLQTLCMNCEWI